MPRIIAHIDMDAFFASIEERENPRFRGRPLVVGADPQGGAGRGVVATANYAARAYGIRSALPISTAWRLAEEARAKGLPPVVFVGGTMRRYGEVSRAVMAIVRAYAPLVEQASVDEAYVDLSFTGSYAKATALCRKIKAEVRAKERLTASIGVGPNKLVAKIASDRNKPDGLTVVKEKDAEAFLEPLPVRTLPGIGPKTEQQLSQLNIRTIKELKKIPKEKLEDLFGKWGAGIYARARGRDDSPVSEEWETKSVGEQETFERDVRDAGILTERLRAVAAGAFARLHRHGFTTFRTVVVTVRFADFSTKNRSFTLKEAAADLKTLEFEAMKLFLPFLDARENPGRKAVRLLGVRMEKLG